ncbi:hypothetical protein BSKO_08284 [Bryopsis sp. KO-2023]|nr:hypothetical protein BSKO_08284 [Bryopsis sp. KO-2023]
MDYYSTDFNEDGEGDFDVKGFGASKEQIVFLIDAHDGMFVGIKKEGETEHQCSFQLAVRVATDMLKARIIASDNDEIGVIFYGTKLSKSASSFDHVFTYLDLDIPDAMRIRQMEEMTADTFKRDIGSGDGASSHGESLKYALWAASQMFEGSAQRASKKILLLTSKEDPCEGLEAVRLQVMSRVEQLRDAKVHLAFFPLVPDGMSFQLDAFWKPVVHMLKDEEEDLDENEDTLVRLDALFDSVRRRAYKKRALSSLVWSLGPDFGIGVQVFALYNAAKKPLPVYLDPKSNEKLISNTGYVCEDTGAILTDIPLSYFEPTSGPKERYPKVIFNQDEKNKIRAVRDPGLCLLGFKPLTCLKDYHQMAHSYFISPDEKKLKGSTTAFIAFHDRMQATGKFALCRFVRSRISEPRLAALVPQQETVDSFGVQVEPPGFYLIVLPYSDDLRHPDSDPSIVGTDIPKANAEQIQLAERITSHLTLSSEFSTVDVPNPQMQRHYQVMEAVALQEPIPSLSEFVDETKPDIDGMKQHQPLVQEFKDAVFIHSTAKKASGSSKRKATGDGVATAVESVDWKDLADKGKLAKLTVAELKKYLEFHKLRLSGKKADLVARIEDHLSKT